MGQIDQGKLCRLRLDCYLSSNLIRVFTLWHASFIFRMHYYVVKAKCFVFRTTTELIQVSQFLKMFVVTMLSIVYFQAFYPSSWTPATILSNIYGRNKVAPLPSATFKEVFPWPYVYTSTSLCWTIVESYQTKS